jgi:hypothetical protein
MLFVHPLTLPGGGRLWMYVPLALCVAAVYRATRARTVAELPRAAALTFLNMTVGMVLIAAAAFAVHEIVLRMY